MSTTVITKPKVEVSEKLLSEIKSQVHESGQVILHFIYDVPLSLYSSYIRIWPTTYLYDKGSAHTSELIHVENITLYPQWFECQPGGTFYFTLIFSGLPKSCSRFDFIEHCTNQAGAFSVLDIHRNDSDVYYLRMS